MAHSADFFEKNHFETPPSAEEKKALFKRSVANVVVEISAYCNRLCTYCPVSQVDRRTTREELPETIFNRIISDLASIEYDRGVCLNLYNEPTADRELLLSRVRTVREKLPGSRIYFSTNGDYLKPDYLQELVNAGLSDLYITLHMPKGKPYNDPHIIGRLTEISARLGKQIKITAYSPNEMVSGEMRLFGIKLSIFSVNYYDLGNDRAGLVQSLTDKATQRVAPCDRPFSDFTVSYDGTVFPCCQMFVDDESHKEKYSIGNIMNHSSIFDIYASKVMASWRSSLLSYGPKRPPCDTCMEDNIPGTPDQVAERETLRKKLVNESQNEDSGMRIKPHWLSRIFSKPRT